MKHFPKTLLVCLVFVVTVTADTTTSSTLQASSAIRSTSTSPAPLPQSSATSTPSTEETTTPSPSESNTTEALLRTTNLPLNSQLSSLVDLIVDLRSHFPEAKILSTSEIDGKTIRPSDAMNQLRLQLSDLP